MNEARATLEPTEMYSLCGRFLGKDVRVFLSTGITLQGKLLEVRGKYILIESDRHGESCVNLDSVTSVTLN